MADLRTVDPRAIPISRFSYELPQDRIATRPLAERDAARSLVFRNGVIQDRMFRELPDLLPEESLLVMNNTRVVNARILFTRSSGGRMEILCLEPADGSTMEAAFARTGNAEWKAMLGNARKWKEGEQVELKAEGAVLKAARSGQDQVSFSWTPPEATFAEVLEKVGHVPLPPYMQRPDESWDKQRYNTVFARHDGSVAAPTASLHITPELLASLKEKGHSATELTLHVGAGTFLPVKSDRMAEHQMHSEQVRIPIDALESLADRLGKVPIVAVGTTALRTLESIYWHGVKILNGKADADLDIGQWDPYDLRSEISEAEALAAVIERTRSSGLRECIGSTRLLIVPGYQFHFTDALVTNFHQPQSTLLLLVAAFIGDDWRRVYEHALTHGYRFLSYGDGSLLFRSA